MCCAGYKRWEGGMERHWEGDMAVFMVNAERDVLFIKKL
jgi:hypothetical protein